MKFLTIVIVAAAVVVATDGEKLPIAKPGCSDRCGNVTIPFPFGTTEGCYLNNNPNFFINCSHGAVPLWLNSSTQITNIFLAGGHLTVTKLITKDCSSTQITNRTLVREDLVIDLPKPFTVSSAANKFIVVGCDTVGSIHGQLSDGRYYRTGCTASCKGSAADVEKGSCTGFGCCRTSIPDNVSQLNITVRSFGYYTFLSHKCGYAFVVEEASFPFSPENITSLNNVTELPVVIDWSIGDGINCTTAKANSSDYGCRSENSECYEADNGYGYRCKCMQGYRGNPYLDHGCRDIDECKDARMNMCSNLEYCVNGNGSFECVCPKGYNGDGRKNGNGCTEYEPSLLIKFAAGICFGIFVILLSACWRYFVVRNRSVMDEGVAEQEMQGGRR